MTEMTEALQSLHTTLVDSREGYEKALDLADGRGLTPLFQEMIALRTRHSAEIEQLLADHAATTSGGTSLMATVHRAVIGIRALFSELDDSILPGLIDGEKRILGHYDDTISAVATGSLEHASIVNQRAELFETILRMEAKAAAAEAV